MNFSLALFFYFLFFIIFLWVFLKWGANFFSAFTLTSILSLIFLNVLLPPSEISKHATDYFSNAPCLSINHILSFIYAFIFIFTQILILLFVTKKVSEEIAVYRSRKSKIPVFF